MTTYDLVVIGAGTGGLVTAAGAAQFGARVALIERDKLGGECLYTGCVPSKAMIHCAKVASLVRRAGEFGIDVPPPRIDFPRAMAYTRKVIETIGRHDSPACTGLHLLPVGMKVRTARQRQPLSPVPEVR